MAERGLGEGDLLEGDVLGAEARRLLNALDGSRLCRHLHFVRHNPGYAITGTVKDRTDDILFRHNHVGAHDAHARSTATDRPIH